ncbi:MAG: rod shape-determining protein MreD [Sporolactobacillus sp.]
MKQFKLFMILFLTLLVQGTIMPRFLNTTSNSSVQMVPEFIFVFLLLTAVFGRVEWSIRYALIFGFLTDIIFTPVLGVYAFSMTLAVYLCTQVARWFNLTIVSALLISVLGVAIDQVIVYFIYLMIGVTDQEFLLFLSNHLLPTLILNAAFMVIAYYPFRLFIQADEDKR